MRVSGHRWLPLGIMTHPRSRPQYYLWVYTALGLGSVALVALRSVFIVIGSNNASRNLGNTLLAHVIRLPMSFFDSQPLGRLLNRFTADLDAIDTNLNQTVSSTMTTLVNVLAAIILMMIITPGIAIAILAVAVVYWRVQQIYVATSREVRAPGAIPSTGLSHALFPPLPSSASLSAPHSPLWRLPLTSIFFWLQSSPPPFGGGPLVSAMKFAAHSPPGQRGVSELESVPVPRNQSQCHRTTMHTLKAQSHPPTTHTLRAQSHLPAPCR